MDVHIYIEYAQRLEKISAFFIRDFSRCQKKNSPKAVHDVRVSARRLMSVLYLVRDFLPQEECTELISVLKKILRNLGAMRDIHIAKEYIGEMLPVFRELTPFYNFLRVKEEKLFHKTSRKLNKFKVNKIKNNLDELVLLLESKHQKDPDISYRQTILLSKVDDSFSSLQEKKRKIKEGDLDSIHNVRVALKKFRYLYENIDIFYATNPEILEEMHYLQTELGQVQDMRLISMRLQEFYMKKQDYRQLMGNIYDEFNIRINAKIIEVMAHIDDINKYWKYVDNVNSENDNEKLSFVLQCDINMP